MSKMLKVVGASWLQTKISSYVLGALGLLAVVALFLGELERIQDDGNYAATVFYSEKSGYRIEYWGQSNELATLPLGVARAYYRQDIDTTGWAQLEIETDPSYKDKIQAYAAGMLEGALTWQAIQAHLTNTVQADCARAEKDCERVKDKLERAANIDKKNAAKYEDEDPFWHQVGLFYDQIDGIKIGWTYGVIRSNMEYEVDPADLYWLNAMSEIREIKKHLNISLGEDVGEYLPGLSSALLKMINETKSSVGKKIFVAHNTAGNYNSMIRILKRYKLNFHVTDSPDSPLVSGTSVQFSGYPAAVTSHDDMYILSGKDKLMTVTGTTLNNFNKDLWKNVNIVDQVPLGPRVSTANRLAANVSSWVHLLARNNSGTACKQWMIVDLKRLDESAVDKREETEKPVDRPYNTMQDVRENAGDITYSVENSNVKHTIVHHGSSGKAKGLFWLLEQVPGYTHSGDLSDALLKQGYWATYGLPYFKDIAANIHLREKEEAFGNIFSYSESPRAQIFKEKSTNLSNIESIINLMRTNNVTLLSNNTELFKGNSEAKKAIEESEDAKNKEDRCDDNTLLKNKIDCIMNEKLYWVSLAVRGDLAHQYKDAFGVIDTKVVSGNVNGFDTFAAISGPTYTTTSQDIVDKIKYVNRGNIAQAFKGTKNHTNTNYASELEVRVNKENFQTIPPFQWSNSKFAEEPHDLQPDRFSFKPFKPTWVW